MSDAERLPGVIECFHVVIRQCPNGSVRRVAVHALAAVEAGGSASLPEQAFLVLADVRAWQGPRASQVKRSLEAFLAAPPRVP